MTTTNINCSKDAYIGSQNPDTNYDVSILDIRSQSGNNYRGLVEFSLASIPAGATINSVTLYLYVDNIFGAMGWPEYLQRITDNSWTETGVTWNNQPTTTTTNRASHTPPTTSQWTTADVTNLVIDAWNAGTTCGIMIIANPENNSSYKENNYDSRTGDNVPYLSVTYTAPLNDVYVNSSAGSDTNAGDSCAAGHPVLTFQKAYSLLNTNGTIHVCNSGADFSGETVTLDKSFSITVDGGGYYYGPKAS